MKFHFLFACAAIAAPAAAQEGPSPATSRVQVDYIQPEKFTDTGRYWGGDKERAANLAELRRHLKQRAARLLPADQILSVSVTNVDIAGGFEPWRARIGDVRVVRDIYPARIDLSFRLTASDGSLVKQGERRLRDPFMSGGVVYRGDPLRYEKALLDDWLERELPARAEERSPAAR
jgi:hypothetical protein